MNQVRINKVFNQLRTVECRYRIIYGGRRSGKSVATSQLMVRRALESVRRVVVLRKFSTTIRHSCWPRMLSAVDECIGLSRCTIRLVDREIRLPNGSVIAFGGLDDVEKWKSAENVSDYWVEEASEITELDFDTLDAGMSTPCSPPPSITCSFNPIPILEHSQHWLQRRFLNVEHSIDEIAVNGDSAVLRTWYKSNSQCPEATVRLIESYRESNESLWRMWGLGEFVALEGAILDPDRWDVVKEVPIGASFESFGLDFGYSADPSACVAVWRSHDELWVKEILVAHGLTISELCYALEESGVRKGVDSIIADSAEPRSIETIRREGFVITGADKRGKSYKREAAQFLRGMRIHVVEPSPTLQTELASWSWKMDKSGAALPIVADGNDHLVDATIYAAFRPGGSLSFEDIERSRADVEPLRRTILSDDLVPLRSAV